MPRQRKEKFKPEQVIAAIEKTKGWVTLTAKALGCTPETVRSYAKKYPEVQKALDEEREKLIDIAELALYTKLQNAEPWAVIFTLKTIGKKRGWTDKEVSSSTTEKSIVTVSYEEGIADKQED